MPSNSIKPVVKLRLFGAPELVVLHDEGTEEKIPLRPQVERLLGYLLSRGNTKVITISRENVAKALWPGVALTGFGKCSKCQEITGLQDEWCYKCLHQYTDMRPDTFKPNSFGKCSKCGEDLGLIGKLCQKCWRDKALADCLSDLRQALGKKGITKEPLRSAYPLGDTSKGNITFILQPSWWVDIIDFKEAARSNDPQKLRGALKLYLRGDFLQGHNDPQYEWIYDERAYLLENQEHTGFLNIVQHLVWPTIVEVLDDLKTCLDKFVDRETPITALKEAIRKGTKRILIGGFGGNGKTALALMLCWLLLREFIFAKIVWVSAKLTKLEIYNETGNIVSKKTTQLTPEELWDAILKSVALEELLSKTRRLSKPATESEKKEAVKALLKSERWLIVIDNLEDAANVEKLLSELQDVLRSSPSQALLTSRERIHTDFDIELEGLDLEYTKALIRYVCGREVPEGVAKGIQEFTDGTPLAVEFIAAQLDGREWHMIREDLERARREYERYKSERDWKGGLFSFIIWDQYKRLSFLAQEALAYIGDEISPEPVSRDELLRAFRRQVIREKERHGIKARNELLKAFGIVSSVTSNDDVLRNALSQQLDKALEELRRFYFVRKVGSEDLYYVVHPLLREFINSDLLEHLKREMKQKEV